MKPIACDIKSYPITIEEMVRDGCTEKMANYYYGLLQNERYSNVLENSFVKWAHSKGFLAESAYAYKLTEDNYMMYLSDYDYYKLWPLNDWMRIWVNDKLTLKYVLNNPQWDKFMPKYFFYSSNNGLRRLVDVKASAENVYEELLEVLRTEGKIACKPANGSSSNDFFVLAYDGEFHINGEKCQKEDVIDFAQNNTNLVYTEYLLPYENMAAISPVIHTLRVVVLNEDGANPRIVGGYLRFGTKAHGFANHMNSAKECKAEYDVVAQVDFETGEFGNGRAVFQNKIEKLEYHPDSKIPIKGKLFDYQKIKNMVLGISEHLFGVEWMGFDIGIDESGCPKIMEINTHPGLKYMQIFSSLYDTADVKAYLFEKMKRICEMNKDEMNRRIKMPR